MQNVLAVPHNMPIESKTENLNWTSLEGTVLSDAYLLERFASADKSTASFATRTGGERSSRALARLVAAEGEAGERQIQVWQAIKRSGHPNLLPIWGTGRTHADGHDLIYVVVEAADENLAGVLGDRALEPAEAGEILVSLVGALGHLHVHRLAHGSLSPEQIFAVGETVKLSTGGVQRIGSMGNLEIHKAKYRAPESAEGNVTPATDIWCLGATLVEALTQRACGKDCIAEAAKLSAPFNEIARSCLQREPEARGSLAHILDLYEGKVNEALVVRAALPKQMAAAAGVGGGSSVPVPEATAAEAEPEPETTLPVYLAPGPVVPEADAFAAEAFSSADKSPLAEADSSAIPKDEPAVDASGAPEKEFPVEWRQAAAVHPAANAPADAAIARAKRRAWIFVAVALAILLAVVWVLRPRSSGGHVIQRQGASSSSVPGVKAGVRNGQTMTLPAATPTGTPAKPAQTPAPKSSAAHPTSAAASPARSGPVWRVILYTYNRAGDAEERAAAINRAHDGLGAEVFMPNGEGKGPYLVALGGSKNREEAAQLRRNAIRSGLPRDAYLRNYSR